MKGILSIVFLLFVFACANAQVKYNGYYIDKDGLMNYGEIFYNDPVSLQQEVTIKDSFGTLYTFHPTDVKAFGYTRRHVTYKYESINDFKGKKVFLQLVVGGRYLKEYLYTTYDPVAETGLQYYSVIVYYKNGTLFISRKRENIKKFKARFFQEDPKLSRMALDKSFDETSGSESQLIFAAYDNWMDRPHANNISDTTMALRGILDADKYYKHISNKYFWKTFWVSRLLTPFVGLFYARHEQKSFTNAPVTIADTTLKKQGSYVIAYNARALTLKNKSINKGLLFSLIP